MLVFRNFLLSNGFFWKMKEVFGKINLSQTPDRHKNNLGNKLLNMENVLYVKYRILSFLHVPIK